MSISTQSPLDIPEISDFVTRLVRAGETNRSIARQVTRGFALETSETAIRRFRKRHSLTIPGTEPAYTKIRGDEAECMSSVTECLDTDFDRMLIERGLDPEDWYIDAVQANKWGGEVKNHQTKFTAKRKKPYVGLMPVRSEGWRPQTNTIPLHVEGIGEMVVICGDQQAPFHDEDLHSLFCEWLANNEPDRGVILGDLGDFPDISRHPADPENLATAQECLQASYDILCDYVEASPNTKWDYLLGNHDERIRQYLIKSAPLLYQLAQVDSEEDEGAAVHCLSHLLRLDELGVNLVDPHGTYENARVQLSDNLAVAHGWKVREGSGATALKTLEQTGYSIIMGHTHRQSCVYHTYHEITGKARQLMAVEAGCMCRLDGKQDSRSRRYPNYMTQPDWQAGFCTATLYDDSKFSVDLAKYVNGVLLWRGERYE